MPFEAIPFSLDSNEISSPTRRGARRSVLLIGASLFAFAAMPSAALAQNECGAPPSGGGSVSCPPSGNPYATGITYNGVVDDLTVVLEPTDVITSTVQVTSNSPYADLRIEGATNTSISTNVSGRPGVSIDAGAGTVYVSVDSVATNQSFSRGITADSSDGTTVFVNNVSTVGKYSPGVVATVTGPTQIGEGQPAVLVDAGTISTQGKYSDGIVGTNPLGTVDITSDSIHTIGTDSDGITANAAGNVTIHSGSVVTTNTRATGIDATSTAGDVTIVSGTVQTGGTFSPGITAHSTTDSVSITSTSVTTGADNSMGINAAADHGDVTVNSGSVQTTGIGSAGIYVSGAGVLTVTSGTVVTIGDSSPGISVHQSGFTPPGDGDPTPCEGPECYYTPAGIVAPSGPSADIGTPPGVVINSTSMTTQGDHSPGISGISNDGYVDIHSGAVHTSGDYSIGIIANAYDTARVVSTGNLTTEGDYSAGIDAFASNGSVTVTSTGTVSTDGIGSIGIYAHTIDVGNVTVGSTNVLTGTIHSTGIRAYSYGGDVTVTSGTVTTHGADSAGIQAGADPYGYYTTTTTVHSTSVTTTGLDSPGIEAFNSNLVVVTSGTVSTTLANSTGITAIQNVYEPEDQCSDCNDIAGPAGPHAPPTLGPGVYVSSGSITTLGANSLGIDAYSHDGFVTIVSTGTISTGGGSSPGISAIGYGNVSVTSNTINTGGLSSPGILALSGDGNVAVTSTAVTTNSNSSTGISANSLYGTVTVTSGAVTTHGTNATGINAHAYSNVTVGSTSVTTTGAGSVGIYAYSNYDNVSVTSGTVTTSGASNARGIVAIAYDGGNSTVVSGTVSTIGTNSTGIYNYAFGGNGSVTSTTVTTGGAGSAGIVEVVLLGNATVTSGSVTTNGASNAAGIDVYATGNTTVTSTGTVTTHGTNSDGIDATARGTVVVTSNNVVTTGNGSEGIYATELGGPGGGAETIPGAAAALGPNGGITITSGNITTSGTGSTGIDAFAYGGDVEITSTGAIATTGGTARGILAVSLNGHVTVDANNVSTTGATSDAIAVTSATTSTVTIRGLVQATNGFEVQATGGATTVNTTASGIIRGAIDLTDNADRVNNAGLFDAIGTSLFGAGADIFTNTGTVRSINGAAVFAALENFNNSALVELRDNAVGDTLNVTGAYVGSGNAHLGVDANIQSTQADVLITGPATGSTLLDVNLIGTPVFNLVGTLVVDATAGTSASAFTLSSTATSSPFVKLNLLFDAPNNNFLLVGLPDQAVFETVEQGQMLIDFWYQSADAVSGQIESAHDGVPPPLGGTTTSHLAGGGRFGGWVQGLVGDIHRDTSQSFTGGGGTTVFDTSYRQDFDGIQGGLDYQAGGAIIGVTFGVGRSNARFNTSFNELHIDGTNVGVYAAFNSGNFFFNALGKVDWANVDSDPGTGISASFDATAWGVRGTAGFHFGDRLFAEPTVSLSWVTVDINDYVSNGASVAFDNIHSLRGAAGIRFGARLPAGHGTFTPFIGIQAVDEFKGDVRTNFTLGTTIGLEQDAPGTFGELSGGLNFSTGRLEAFVRGELDFGSERDGLAGRAGLRLRF